MSSIGTYQPTHSAGKLMAVPRVDLAPSNFPVRYPPFSSFQLNPVSRYDRRRKP
ncbi:hypothetical protein FF011L_10940 [Roseimaritima multifibrata]|uniref:Uncharacterized protein n=1 Tax=Roseimaritima multifibrata TaxID=1930274 RepID=A0A517MBV2_9BACT|nr:hypothetical protein FF011L_10940 [Roseimaritima multifibrata]